MKHSDELKNIAKALAKFQADIKDPARDKDNPYFKSKYVALDGLLDAVRPVLATNGLSFIQSPVSNGQDMGVTTLLMHESGEWIESDPFMLHAVKNDPQAGGSAITYARRYSLSAVLGVAWDDDDDANIATKGQGKFDTKFNRNDENASQSRFNGQNNPAKGNYTKAEPEKANGVPKRSTEQKTVNAGGGNTRTKLNIHMMQEAGKRGAQRNLLEFAAKYGVKQFDDITRLSDNDFTKLYTDFMTWLNPA